MKKYTLLITISLIMQLHVSAQSCLPDGITFTNQVEVDSFQINYPNCTTIEGDVSIGGNVINLNGLDVLSAIDGSLNIGLYSYDNLLTSLTGLDSLTAIGGDLHIDNNRQLTSLSGLGNIDSIGGNLIIISSRLTNLSGLNNLGFIGDGIRMDYNLYLTNLTGLENIISIGGGLVIRENYSLLNLRGLDSLSQIGGELKIRFNYALTNIDGIRNVEASSITYLEIEFNPFLSECSVNSVCDYLLNSDGSASIFDNPTGCNSIDEVKEACIVKVPNISSNQDFLIFPSLATYALNIFVPKENENEKHHLFIYDLYGRKVEETDVPPGTTTLQLNVSGWSSGLYTAIASYNGKVSGRGKFVVR